MDKKDIAIIVIILIILVGGIYLIFNRSQPTENSQNTSMQNTEQKNSQNNSTQNAEQNNNPSSYNIQGMKVEILKEGSGPAAKSGDNVTVNYVGTLENGTKFDSSIDRGVPLPLVLGQNSVIKGWELGLIGMKVGEKRKLTIPPELAYGKNAVGNIIPANSTLIFEIDMVKIN